MWNAPILGIVGGKKLCPFLDRGIQSPIFCTPNHCKWSFLGAKEYGTSDALIQQRRPLFVANYPKNCNWVKLGWIDPGSRLSAKKPLNNLIWRRWLPEPTIFVALPNKYIVSNIIRISTCMESTFAIESFWDALASLGSMLESQSLSNVFEILSNPGHIFRVCSEYVQIRFRVGSE